MTPPRKAAAALYDPSLEEAVLGAMLHSPDVCRLALEKLCPDDFGAPDARALFEIMARLNEGDWTRVVHAARQAGQDVRPYVAHLAGSGTSNPKLVDDMLQLRLRRSLEDAGELARKAAEAEDPEEALRIVRMLVAEEPSNNGTGMLLSWSNTFRAPEPIRWIEPRYIPAGHLTIVEGEEGIGKGLYCAWLTVRASQRGEPVLWVSTEDDPEREIYPRLLAAGYNPKQDAPVAFAADPFLLKLPADIAVLQETVMELDARLVILDPGRDLIWPEVAGQARSNNDDTMIRPALSRLHRAAVETGAALVFVHHFNKQTGPDTRARSSGSGSFRQVARHVVVMARDNGSAALGVAKSNISDRTGTVQAYQVRGISLGGEATSARIELGELEDDSTIEAWISRKARERRELEESNRDPCPECGGVVRGRVDQVYCSANCRKRAHSRSKRPPENPAGTLEET